MRKGGMAVWQVGIGTGSKPATTKAEAEGVLAELGISGIRIEMAEEAETGLWLVSTNRMWNTLIEHTNGLSFENGGGAYFELEKGEDRE